MCKKLQENSDLDIIDDCDSVVPMSPLENSPVKKGEVTNQT